VLLDVTVLVCDEGGTAIAAIGSGKALINHNTTKRIHCETRAWPPRSIPNCHKRLASWNGHCESLEAARHLETRVREWATGRCVVEGVGLFQERCTLVSAEPQAFGEHPASE